MPKRQSHIQAIECIQASYQAPSGRQDSARLQEAETALQASEARYRVLAESSPLGIWHIDLQGYTLYANPAMCGLLGVPNQESLSGINYKEFFDQTGLKIIQRQHESRVKGEASDYEVVLYDLKGGRHDILIAGAPVVDANGKLISLIGTFVDVTERKIIERHLHVNANALDNIAEGLVIQDSESRVVQVNRSFTTITGYKPEEVLGRSMSLLYSKRHGAEFYRRMQNIVLKRGHWRGEVWHRKKTGELYPALLSLSTVRDEKQCLTHYVFVFRDISPYKEYERSLTHIAHHDGLTGLPNRTLFEDRVNSALARARRQADMLALLFIDLDNFKIINDTLGHAAGDELLKLVTRRLQESVREIDTIARLGGDEFIVLLEGLQEPDNASQLAVKVLTALAQPFRHGGLDLYTGASIGISIYPGSGNDLFTLMKNADLAMYQAKRSGGNNYKFFSPEMSTFKEMKSGPSVNTP